MSLIQFPVNTAGELYVRALSSAFQRGSWIADPDFAHIQDPEAYEKICRDPEIAHAMIFRKHLIAGRDWYMHPASDRVVDARAAKVVEQCLKEVMRFSGARFNLADAVFRGSAFAKIVGHKAERSFGDGKAREWWFPIQLRDLDRWRFRQVPLVGDIDVENKSKAKTKWQYWDTTTGQGKWTDLTRKQRQRLVVHIYDDRESTLGYGKGLLEALYHFYWAKTIVMREGLAGIERWAQGWVIAKIDGMRIGDPTRDNDAQVEAALQMLESFRSRHVAAVDKNEEIDVKETSGTGHEIVMSMLHYLDQALSRLILAGLLPTGGGGDHGSLGRAREEADSTESLVHFDRDLLGEDITRDVVGPVWRTNRSNMVALGLADAEMPRFRIRHQRRSDPVKGIEVIMNAIQSNIPLKRDEVYEAINFSVPNPEDIVINQLSPDDTIQGRNPLTGRFMGSPKDANGDAGKGGPGGMGTRDESGNMDSDTPRSEHQQSSGGE